MFDNVPDDFMSDGHENHEPTKREIEKALRDVGFSMNSAKAFIAGGLKAVNAEDEAKEAAQKILTIFGGKQPWN